MPIVQGSAPSSEEDLMSFYETRFPDAIAYGSSGGPRYSTTVLELESGHEKRNVNWAKSRAIYNIATGIKEPEDMDEVIAFFRVMRGRAYGFRFKDWSDYIVAPLTEIGIGDGIRTEFQVVKRYQVGGVEYVREIRKLVAGTFLGLFLDEDGVPNEDFSVDHNTGVVTFAVAPAVGKVLTIAGCEFDVPVRFDIDDLDITYTDWQALEGQNIPLVEIRV